MEATILSALEFLTLPSSFGRYVRSLRGFSPSSVLKSGCYLCWTRLIILVTAPTSAMIFILLSTFDALSQTRYLTGVVYFFQPTVFQSSHLPLLA